MNSLSWFLYFAGIITSISVVTTLIGVACLIYYLIIVINIAYWNDGHSRGCKPYPKPKVVGYAFAFFFLTAIIPNQNTMYAIAASQMGEKALESTIGKKSLIAIEKWIDSQIEGAKK